MFNLTDVVKNLIILNVLVFLVTHVIPMININFLAVYYPGTGQFSPYQLITHLFTHGGFSHLLFNMIGLAVFGPLVEQKLGLKKFFILYFGAGLFSFLLSYLIHVVPMNVAEASSAAAIGASGAIMGVSVAYAMNFPNNKLQLLFPPVTLKAAYLVAGYVVLDLVNGFGSANTGISHFGHLGGALFGFLITLYWNRYGNTFKR